MTTQALPTTKVRATRIQRRVISNLAKDRAPQTIAFMRSLVRVFDDLGNRGVRAFDELTPPPVRVGDPEDAGRVAAIVRNMLIDDFTEEIFAPQYRAAYLRVLSATVNTVNLTLAVSVNLPDHVARQIVADGGTRLGLIDLSAQSRDALFRALAEGRAEGLAREALARRIYRHIVRGPWRSVGMRALVIARTEVLHAQRISSLATYRRIEIVSGVRAFDAQIGATDADCEARDGLVYSFNDADSETGSEHPNGTLSWAPHVGR